MAGSIHTNLLVTVTLLFLTRTGNRCRADNDLLLVTLPTWRTDSDYVTQCSRHTDLVCDWTTRQQRTEDAVVNILESGPLGLTGEACLEFWYLATVAANSSQRHALLKSGAGLVEIWASPNHQRNSWRQVFVPLNITDPAAQVVLEEMSMYEQLLFNQIGVRRGSCGPQCESNTELWTDESTRCLCSVGQLSCSPSECPKGLCGPQRGVTSGIATSGTCTIHSHTDSITFDGVLFRFMASCTYVLTKTCSPTEGLPVFSVEVVTEQNGNSSLTTVQHVTVNIGKFIVSLLRKHTHQVVVNGVWRKLPLNLSGTVNIMGNPAAVTLGTSFGLSISYDSAGAVHVTLPSIYADKVCGLCGNFNHLKEDDLRKPDSTNAQNATTLAQSWQTPQTTSSCDTILVPHQCDALQEAEYASEPYCGALLSSTGPFAECQSVLGVQSYYRSCVVSMCTTHGDKAVLCETLQAYDDMCQEAGVNVPKWRNSSFCSLQCGKNSHYNACADGCPEVCSSLDIAGSCGSCEERCECQSGFKLSGGNCVPSEDCGCWYNGKHYEKGATFVEGECVQQCQCIGNNDVRCTSMQCAYNDVCKVKHGVKGCFPFKPVTCMVYGDPHYITFDRMAYDFQGGCSYTLTTTCGESSVQFSVIGHNMHPPLQNFSRSKLDAVTLQVEDLMLTLNQSGEVYVNNSHVWLPYTTNGTFGSVKVYLKNNYITLETTFGLQIMVDGENRLFLQVDEHYKYALCGLCGTYSGHQGDDFITPGGQNATEPFEFGDSWRVRDNIECTAYPNDPRLCDYEEENEAYKECSTLLGDAFKPCHELIHPSIYLNSCVYDYCATNGEQHTLCESLKSYAAACQIAGVELPQWQNNTACADPPTTATSAPTTATTSPTPDQTFCPMNCDFEKNLCGWEQLIQDSFDWTRHSGPTPSNITGPNQDHTTGAGFYMYIEGNSATHGDPARLLSSMCHYNGTLCLHFWYHMYGSATAMALNIYVLKDNKATKVWSMVNNQGPEWHPGNVDINVSDPFKIIVEGIRGSNAQSDVAIDDISIQFGLCSDSKGVTTDPGKPHQTVTGSLSVSVPTFVAPENPVVTVTAQTHLINTTIPPLEEATANITNDKSPALHPDLSGDATTQPQKPYQNITATISVPLTTTVAQQSPTVTVTAQSPIMNATIPPLSEATTNTKDQHPVCQMDCDFEQDLCEWSQMPTDAFDWRRHSGSTPTLMTGPSSDHTTEGGHYLYIEASSVTHGDTARLFSSGCSDSGPQCLRFWYHMYGSADTMGLHVYVYQDGKANAVWRKRNDQGNMWHMAEVDITTTGTFQIIFEGRRGSNDRSDVAIDDVKLYRGFCSDLSGDVTTQPQKPYQNVTATISVPLTTTVAQQSPTVTVTAQSPIMNATIPPLSEATTNTTHQHPVCRMDCDFEQDLCEWSQMPTDAFDWTRYNSSTPTLMTGPSSDHTTGGGHYLYIEASSVTHGDTARLISSGCSDSGPQCLRFWYHMYGSADTMGLHVYVYQNGTADVVWRKRNDQGNMWHMAEVDITTTGTFQIIFEGRRGSNDRSDVAIDDVKLYRGLCSDLSGDVTTQPQKPYQNVTATISVPLTTTVAQQSPTVTVTAQSPIMNATIPPLSEATTNTTHQHPDLSGDATTQPQKPYQNVTATISVPLTTTVAQQSPTVTVTAQSPIMNATIPPLSEATTNTKDQHPVCQMDCDFEQDLCEWSQMPTDAFDWRRHSGSTPTLMTGPSSDHTTEGGHYLYIEASSVTHGDTARLISSGCSDYGPQCLQFWYHMYGSADTMGLHVYVYQDGKANAVWRKRNDQGNMWHMAEVDITTTGTFQIIFEGRRGSNDRSDVAIDDVKLYRGLCSDLSGDVTTQPQKPYQNVTATISVPLTTTVAQQSPTVTVTAQSPIMNATIPPLSEATTNTTHQHPVCQMDCDFEQDLCEWSQMPTDAFDWRRHSGSTPTLMTGPSSDHTTEGGHYLYIEASSVTHGDTARLFSSGCSDSGPQCLRFWYHMYGSADTMGLHVYMYQNGTADVVWRKRNDQGNMWHMAEVDITTTGTFQIIFEGRRGSNDRSDVAIDDVKLYRGLCSDLSGEVTTQPQKPYQNVTATISVPLTTTVAQQSPTVTVTAQSPIMNATIPPLSEATTNTTHQHPDLSGDVTTQPQKPYQNVTATISVPETTTVAQQSPTVTVTAQSPIMNATIPPLSEATTNTTHQHTVPFCPENSHYTTCIPVCSPTCTHLNGPLRCIDSHTCVPGCVCNDGFVQNRHVCVPIKQCGCVDRDGRKHQFSETWYTNRCSQKCECEKDDDVGKIDCADKDKCDGNAVCLQNNRGNFYCQSTAFSECTITKDPEYKTFDKLKYDFEGEHSYVLVRTNNLPINVPDVYIEGLIMRNVDDDDDDDDSEQHGDSSSEEDHSLTVTEEEDEDDTSEEHEEHSRLQQLKIRVYNHTVEFKKNKRLVVDGRITNTPVSPIAGLKIQEHSSQIYLETDFGLSVKFDGRNTAEIILPHIYKRKVGGLCGNFDGQKLNDQMKPDGTRARDAQEFGDSWTV